MRLRVWNIFPGPMLFDLYGVALETISFLGELLASPTALS